MDKQTRRSHKVRRPPEQPATPAGPLELVDGDLEVTIRGGTMDGKKLTLDVLAVKMACEAVETKHRCGEPGWLCTPQFLADLAAAIAGQGVEGCTPTLAYKLWHAVSLRWVEVKKNIPLPPNSAEPTESTPSNSPEDSS